MNENQQAAICGQERLDLFRAAIPFVMARRKSTGGFGATPRLPATIEDTYHALNILSLVRQWKGGEEEFDPLGDENLHAFLDARLRCPAGGTKTVFQLFRARRAAGLDPGPGTAAAAVRAATRAADSLEDWYYCARVLSEAPDGNSWPIEGEKGFTAALRRGWRSVDEAWMHLYLSREFFGVLPPPELIGWFQACQNGDGGFGFFPGTTSFVENCHATLRALKFLGAEPSEPMLAFRFLAGCQTISGGFGRSSRAAPFLDATWHALAGIALLPAGG